MPDECNRPEGRAAAAALTIAFARARTERRTPTATSRSSQCGQPAGALERYLGAYGHVVALRKPNLAYAHVHATSEDLKMGSIVFAAELPTARTYRLFLQFRAGGTVHTAPFTIGVRQ